MSLGCWVQRALVMDDATWARHANPRSVWTRFTILPLLVLAVWSRVWLGWWALVPAALVLVWTWWNPRAFPPPRSTGNWASKAVLGVRLWLSRRRVPVPARHRILPTLLAIATAAGVPFLVWGLATLEIWPTLFGMAVVYAGKLWLIDRMVWLYEDVNRARLEGLSNIKT